MSWVILVFIDEMNNHFKYYALESSSQRRQQVDLTGRVRWGRIGTEGQSRTFDVERAEQKYQEKLREGYRLMGVQDSPWVDPDEARDFNNTGVSGFVAQEPEPEPEPTGRDPDGTTDNGGLAEEDREEMSIHAPEELEAHETAVQRASRRITQARNTGTSNIKTNREGYINIPGYERTHFDDFLNEISIEVQRNFSSQTRKTSAKTYYQSLPASLFERNHKYQWDELSRAELPQFLFVFHKQTCIGIISVNRNLGIVDIFSIKTTANRRKNLTKFLLKRLGNAVREGRENTEFKIRHQPTKQLIEEVAPYVSSRTRTSIIYKTADLRRRVSLPTGITKPPRWIE